MTASSRRFSTLAATVAIAVTTAAAGTPVQVTFPTPPPKGDHAVHSNFLGLSMELSFLNVFFGNSTDTTPAPILSYLGAVRSNTGSQPFRIRLGGNSMDSSSYVPDQTNPIVNFTNPHANFNDQPIDFGPALLEQLKYVGDKVGGSEYTIGLSLLEPNDSRAVNVPIMAAGAKKVFGDELDVYLLGNEPDLYTGHQKRPSMANYTVPIYISEWETASNGLRNTSEGNLLDKPRLGGPTICCGWDLATLIQQGYLEHVKKDLKYISLQHYPQNYCFNNQYKYEVDYYLQHQQVVSLAQWQEYGIQLAVQQGVPVIMSEFNTASCGGVPKVSDTFAAGALWVIDYSLQLAMVGYTAAYVHQREPTIVYNLFDAPRPAGSAGPWSTNPGFYAMLVMPEILNAEAGSRVIDLNLNNSMFDVKQDMAGYAMYDAASTAINRLALFNYANATENGAKTYNIPKEVFTNATTLGLADFDATKIVVKYLTAANANSKFDISWAGKTYENVTDGNPVDAKNNRPSQVTLDCSNGCSVDVPGPGLAVVYIGGTAAKKPSGTGASSTTSSSSSSPTSKGDNGALRVTVSYLAAFAFALSIAFLA